MAKNKHQHYGTFEVKGNGRRKITRNLVMIITVGIFISGMGIFIFKHYTKPVKQSETSVASEIPGWWYQQYFGSSACNQDICKEKADPDSDKLTNIQEFFYHTNPLSPYTIGDKLTDGELVAAGFDPSKSGKVTFDEAATPENLLGESLVFGDDIKQMVADDQDIGKVNLPQVKDDELRINYSDTEVVYRTYADKLEQTINKYFRQQDITQIKEILKSGSDSEAEDIGLRSRALASELKTIEVPFKLLMFHKYNVVMFQLLSEIIPAPTNMSGSESDAWYEKVQQFLAVQQKLSFEEQALKQNQVSP